MYTYLTGTRAGYEHGGDAPAGAASRRIAIDDRQYLGPICHADCGGRLTAFARSPAY